MSEEWEGYREDRSKKKKQNQISSVKILKERGVPFETMNEGNGHYRIGEYDFWATTGKFIHRPTKKHGRGVFNLLKLIK